MIKASVVADSISPSGDRITTMQVTFHRFILAEFNTHRMFSRNFSSSRAIPTSKLMEQDMALPVFWGKNRAGMQAVEELEYGDRWRAEELWRLARSQMDFISSSLLSIGLHKQLTNRLVEPFKYVTGVVTATEWSNFFALRNHPAAQPEIQQLARVMQAAILQSVPAHLKEGDWHLPYIFSGDDVLSVEDKKKCSAARCARVSYLKHDGESPSIEDDLELYNQLVTRPHTDKRGFHYGEYDPIHASPLEHQATPIPLEAHEDDNWIGYNGITHLDVDAELWSANFKGWIQHRKVIEHASN